MDHDTTDMDHQKNDDTIRDRVTTLEVQMGSVADEVERNRESREVLVPRFYVVEEGMKTIVGKLLPEIDSTLKNLATEIRALRESHIVTKGKSGTLYGGLMFVLEKLLTPIVLIYVAYVIHSR